MTADFPTAPSASGYRGTASGRRRGKVSSRLTHRISDTPSVIENIMALSIGTQGGKLIINLGNHKIDNRFGMVHVESR